MFLTLASSSPFTPGACCFPARLAGTPRSVSSRRSWLPSPRGSCSVSAGKGTLLRVGSGGRGYGMHQLAFL